MKFEPSLEMPALQFLESVDKESNADKAGLKPLDFVLEINSVDVTCRSHFECVKLIKRAGDTLALKVYTPSPHPNNSTLDRNSTGHSSYYAASNLIPNDGYKSLPHKKKRKINYFFLFFLHLFRFGAEVEEKFSDSVRFQFNFKKNSAAFRGQRVESLSKNLYFS